MALSFWGRIKLRFRDIGTIKALCLGAEKHAHKCGEDKPGAEHFLLSALDLPDGTVRRIFERIEIDPDGFHEAIRKQYSDALSSIGIDEAALGLSNAETIEIGSSSRLYNASPSGQSVFQKLVSERKLDKDIPLLGAHVVRAIASMEQGVAARALRAMGVDQRALMAAIEAELGNYAHRN